MIIEYVRYRIPPDQSREFKQAWANAQEPLRSSPHCFAYEAFRCQTRNSLLLG
jgi:quinol monooxygenase YgiN